MTKAARKAAQIDIHELEYRKLRAAGSTHDQALNELGYLHPITIARLKKRIAGGVTLKQRQKL